jgi:hypothetical protein
LVVIIACLAQTDQYQAMSDDEKEKLEDEIALEAGFVLNNFLWLVRKEQGLDVELPEDGMDVP